MASDTENLQKEFLETIFTDVQAFAEHFLSHLLSPGIPEFHSEIYKLLPDSDRLVIAAPRGFAKSTISSVIYPIWLAVTGLRKDICIISASEGLAMEILLKIKRELEGNQKLLQYFKNFQTDKWATSHFITNTGVSIRAKGAGGQIRGFRPDCLILDDIETDESVQSEEQRKKLKDWLFKACLNTLLPDGQFILVGTILTPLSLLNELLLTENGWKKKRYKAYVDGIQEPGHELWPSQRPHAWLQTRKAEIGSTAFASEFMNDPRLDEAAPIKENMIRYWEKLPDQMNLVISVDPAYSEENNSDFKVASLIGLDTSGNRYLIHYNRSHVSLRDFMDCIINMWLQNKGKIIAVGVPNSGTEKSFFSSFLSYCQDRNLFPPMFELKNIFITQTGASIRAKTARIVAALQPLFETGKYYINPSHVEAREELLSIGSSRWDDIIDTMCYGEQMLQPYGKVDFTVEDDTLKNQSRYGDERPRQQRRQDYGIE